MTLTITSKWGIRRVTLNTTSAFLNYHHCFFLFFSEPSFKLSRQTRVRHAYLGIATDLAVAISYLILKKKTTRESSSPGTSFTGCNSVLRPMWHWWCDRRGLGLGCATVEWVGNRVKRLYTLDSLRFSSHAVTETIQRYPEFGAVSFFLSCWWARRVG